MKTRRLLITPMALALVLCMFLSPVASLIVSAEELSPDFSGSGSDGVKEFVTRLYDTCLGRKPDKTGLNDWVSQLTEKGATGTSVAYGFFTSREFLDKKTTDKQYIKYLYKAILGRTAEEEGLNYWVSEMKKGKSREEIFCEFTESQEFSKLCKKYGIVKGYHVVGSDSVKTAYVNLFVERLYNEILERDCDNEGMSYWTKLLVSKEMSGGEVAYGFLFSDEFLNKHLCNKHYTEVLYKALLGRKPDSTGRSYWVSLLKKKTTREEVFKGFLSSNEFNEICKSYGIKVGTVKTTGKTYENGDCVKCNKDPEPQKYDGKQVRKVLVIAFDPLYKDGKRLHELSDTFSSPEVMAKSYIEEMKTLSGGYANYEISEMIYLNEMPRSNEQGNYFQYTNEEYRKHLNEPDYIWPEPGFMVHPFDYEYYLSNKDNVLGRKNDLYTSANLNEFEEVWFFGPPYAYSDMDETRMVGKNAFFVNGDSMEKDCSPFIVYGFNYGRGIDCMLEDSGHRMEDILDHVYGYPGGYYPDVVTWSGNKCEVDEKAYKNLNEWAKFKAIDADIPNHSGLGWMHLGPNGKREYDKSGNLVTNEERDYDWLNETYVKSNCYKWLDDPAITKDTKVNCYNLWMNDKWTYEPYYFDAKGKKQIWETGEGGNPGTAHHRWWFHNIPRGDINSKSDGKHYDNWWRYFTLDFLRQ